MENKPKPFLAILLSIGVMLFFGWSSFNKSQQDLENLPKDQIEDTKQTTNEKPNVGNDKIETSNDVKEDKLLTNLSKKPKRQIDEQFITIRNEHVRAKISTVKGKIINYKLKKYHETTDDSSPLIDLFDETLKANALGLDLNYPEYDDEPYFEIYDQTQDNKVTLKWSSNSLDVYYTLSLDPRNPYLINSQVNLINKSNQDLNLTPGLQIKRQKSEEESKGGFLSFLSGPKNIFIPMYYQDEELVKKEKLDELTNEQFAKGKINWTAIGDRYFLLSLVADTGLNNNEISYGLKDDLLFTKLNYGSKLLRSGDEKIENFYAYIGPKKRDALKALPYSLEKSIDYGFLEPVAIGLLWLLIKIHSLVGNWGLAIIFLTFLVKMVLHPINKKSMQSMKAMQKVQPKLKEIREKYKNDKQKLNTEMMQLFKTHKVNPMGGCLPMVLQMPIYFALYQVLWNSIELYHTPFFWVYQDLSAPDPYLITPILLGVFMMLQQKLNPQSATMEPAQQKMMLIMPLMFSGVMLFFPFGLVLYILVNTVMSVIQQYMIQRDLSFMDLIKKLTGKSKEA
jgi:YidC/Oxa1 family membrane protein insertase